MGKSFLSTVMIAGLLLLATPGCDRKSTAAVEQSAATTASASGPAPRLRVVAHGEEIKLESYLVPGKTVVCDFFSEYCGPCQRLAPVLEQLAEKNPDVYVVKVDINRPGVEGIDWGSPVARQFKLGSIPHLKIYSPQGVLQVEGDDAMKVLGELCQKAGIS